MRVNMFVLFGALSLLGPMGALEAQATPATGRIGYIDSQIIVGQAPGAREAQEEFDRQMTNYTRELQTMGAELDTLYMRYEQQQAALLPNIRQAREAEIQQKQQRYETRMAELEQEAEATRQRLMAPILEQLTGIIEAMRAELGYAMIFDAAATAIVAADPSLDLTPEVIRRMGGTPAAQTPAQSPAPSGNR